MIAIKSWVIKEKSTGAVIMETFDPKKVAALNIARYQAVPIQEHLAGLSFESNMEQANTCRKVKTCCKCGQDNADDAKLCSVCLCSCWATNGQMADKPIEGRCSGELEVLLSSEQKASPAGIE